VTVVQANATCNASAASRRYHLMNAGHTIEVARFAKRYTGICAYPRPSGSRRRLL
jgi:hypothetical protein